MSWSAASARAACRHARAMPVRGASQRKRAWLTCATPRRVFGALPLVSSLRQLVWKWTSAGVPLVGTISHVQPVAEPAAALFELLRGAAASSASATAAAARSGAEADALRKELAATSARLDAAVKAKRESEQDLYHQARALSFRAPRALVAAQHSARSVRRPELTAPAAADVAAAAPLFCSFRWCSTARKRASRT